MNVKYSDGSSKKVTGACEMPEGFEGKGGTYTAKFVVTDTSNLNDVYGLLETVEVEVIVEKMSPSISIEIAERIVYDGKEPSVTVNSNVNDYTVSYYQGNTKLDGYPKKAGTYKVVVTIAETSNNAAASSEKTFVIVDYSALIAKISEVSALDEKNYTNASWLSLVTQKETAQKIIDDNIAMQLEIDEALQNLSSSVANLVSKADFSMLQTAIASAEALILDEYEETGKDVFIAALAKAKGIFENGDALQKDVDAAESNLKLAQMALKKIEKETNSGGCGSTVMVGGIASILALVGVAAFVMRKKEDDK